MIYDGQGNDKLFGQQHNDRLYGGPGHDRLNGGDGRDWLVGAAAKKNQPGCNERDVLIGTTQDLDLKSDAFKFV
ncbi:MAG: hypothetical protein F6K19_39520 [Cyanothece sp. SIO1E1]|nr:hypothetical protein [Cyanothece sp. SIO1E1]